MVDYPEDQCSVCSDCGFVVSPDTINRCPAEKTIMSRNKRARSPSRCNREELTQWEEDIKTTTKALEKWKDVRIGDSTEKNLVFALEQTTRIAVALSIPITTLERAALLYKEIAKKGLIKGRSMKALAATAVFIACKEQNMPITTRRVAAVSSISPRKITRFYRVLARRISIKPQTINANKYVEELSTRLHASEKTKFTAEKIISSFQLSQKLGGEDPMGIASAAIYISFFLHQERRTQREIAEVSRITEQTLRVRCKEIQRALHFDVSL
jgi:transcription initiation factor TFIIB